MHFGQLPLAGRLTIWLGVLFVAICLQPFGFTVFCVYIFDLVVLWCRCVCISGTVDECNAAIGLASSHLASPTTPGVEEEETSDSERKQLQTKLHMIQNYLFDLGAHLATPRSTSTQSKIARTQFSPNAASQLESWIDAMDKDLAPLATFVLPGGHPAAAALHLARTIARRAERAVTPLFTEGEQEIDESAYCFINRLSDYLFVASRHANRIMGVADVTWSKGADNVNA